MKRRSMHCMAKLARGSSLAARQGDRDRQWDLPIRFERHMAERNRLQWIHASLHTFGVELISECPKS